MTRAEGRNQLLDKLFDGSDFTPRIHCGLWTPSLLWSTIASDLGIWIAYMMIPVVMYIVLKRRGTVLPFRHVWGLYVAFILFCGQTHLIDVFMFWWPAYRFALVIKFCTAIISLLAAWQVGKLLPLLLTMKTPEQVAEEIVEARMVTVREMVGQIAVGVDSLITRQVVPEAEREQILHMLSGGEKSHE